MQIIGSKNNLLSLIMQLGMYIPKYTLLPYKETVIDNFKMR